MTPIEQIGIVGSNLPYTYRLAIYRKTVLELSIYSKNSDADATATATATVTRSLKLRL